MIFGMICRSWAAPACRAALPSRCSGVQLVFTVESFKVNYLRCAIEKRYKSCVETVVLMTNSE